MNESDPSPPTDDADSTRQRLVTAARRAFAARGFAGASVREITREAGANLGAITYHFGSKQHLYDAVLEDAFLPVRAVLRDMPSTMPGASALQRIEALVRAVFQQLEVTPELPSLIMHQAMQTRALPGTARQALGEVLRVLSELVRAGQADGSIRPGDPRVLALSIWSQPVYFGLVRRLAADLVFEPDRPWPGVGFMADHAVRFIRHGLASEAEG